MQGGTNKIKRSLARWADRPEGLISRKEFWAMSVAMGLVVAATLAFGFGNDAVEGVLALMFGSSSMVSERVMSAIGVAGPIVAGLAGLVACAAAISSRVGDEGYRMGHYALAAGAMTGSAALYFVVIPLIEIALAAIAVFLVLGGLIAAALDS